jgi:glycosyltransferase involved in cell wall biosynthesis
MEPIITIGMPVFNDILFIKKSLNAILNQTETRFRLIISDDGATDGSGELCQKYADNYEQIVYIKQPKNLGISKNMEFLLSKSDTPYFMWAADDDVWHEDYIKNMILLLENDSEAIAAFCQYDRIDENDKYISTRNFNYTETSCIKQLLQFIPNADDAFGYGVFKTDKIKNVRFPIWWWPNKKTPYNNIYPSLCFYLNQGKYVHYDKESLFFNRIKDEKNINHVVSGKGNAMKELIAYFLRRLYLVHYSTMLLFKTNNKKNIVVVYPFLVYHWFIRSSVLMLKQSILKK